MALTTLSEAIAACATSSRSEAAPFITIEACDWRLLATGLRLSASRRRPTEANSVFNESFHHLRELCSSKIFQMLKAFIFTAAIFASLCLSSAFVIPASIDFSRVRPTLPDDKTVRKNFDYLVGLIHNNPKWVTKILVQIKKEMLLRGKLSARSGLKCASCIFQIQYNLSDAADVDPYNEQHQSGDPRLWNEVLAESAEDTIDQASRSIFDQIFKRSRRSLTSKLARRSNDSQGPNTTSQPSPKITPTTTPDAQPRGGSSNLTTLKPPTANTTTTARTMTTTLQSVTRRPTQAPEFERKDGQGRAIERCDEESRKTYCLHNGKCIKLKILEMKSCS